ncbi:MAG: LysE family translocator [Ottowia sp.]|nr:LysE family translocator [Ottowia sp.]
MPTLQVSLTFFGAAALLALAPGPDIIFVIAQSASSGRRTGFAVLSGLLTGVLGHTLAVALGLAALLAASAAALTVLKGLGAAYLLYLAWGAWNAGTLQEDAAASSSGMNGAARQPWLRLMARGVLMNLSNPKVLLFFLAFLPQFVQPAQGPAAMQIVWFGLLFIAASGLVFGCAVLLADALRKHLMQSARVQRGLNRCAALVFAGFALHLIFFASGRSPAA